MTRQHRQTLATLTRLRDRVAIALCVVGVTVVSAAPGDIVVDDAAVEQRIAELQGVLLQGQLGDGSWPRGVYTTGQTALCVLALKHSGLPNDHPALARGVRYLVNNFEARVYSEGLVACALELVDPQLYRDRVRQSVRYLQSAQNSSGTWSYYRTRSKGDNSNAQFAVLGLAAAERCGFEISETVKKKALRHWLHCQSPRGGWGYRKSDSAYLSMTCAGIASLHLLGRRREVPAETCGTYREDRVFRKALAALYRQMTGTHGLAGSRRSYALYALERVGILLDLKEIAGVDWYRWGAREILSQTPSNVGDVAFDLLFLAKGEAQVAIAKWQWNGDWNNDRGDVRRWVELTGKALDLKLDWIPAKLSSPETPAAKASLIFVNGHSRFTATSMETEVLREFLKRGGALVAEGCCDSRPFIDSFRTYVKDELFSKYRVEFVEIGDAHPICQQTYSLTGADVSAETVRTGCRSRNVVLLRRDVSCALNGEPCEEGEVERAEKLAVNLLQWAMRSKLPRSKLDDVSLVAGKLGGTSDLPLASQKDGQSLARRYQQPFGRLIHRGEWQVDSSLFPTLKAALAPIENAPQCDAEVFVHPQSEDLFDCALLFASGHEDPALTPAELLPLRAYLQRGGTLMATACCGSAAFDRGFRRLLEGVLPNDRLEVIPSTDSVWTRPLAVTERPVQATLAFGRQHGSGYAPLLGVRRDGRWIVLYSPADLCCDLEGDLDETVVAYRKESAIALWINCLHYAFSP